MLLLPIISIFTFSFPGFFSGFEGAFTPPPKVFSAPIHAIYMTSSTAAGTPGEKLMDDFLKVGGNAVVFDVQDSGGHLAFPSNVPLSAELGNRGERIKNLQELVSKIHDRNMYAIARFVLFKNYFLAAKKPAWTLKRKGTARPFVSRDGPIWLDPGNDELRQYIFDVAREIADAGVDEIQFDYVRFPEGGYYTSSFTGSDTMTRDQAMTSFIAEAADVLHERGVSLSMDVFGIVVWDNISWKVIGQNVGELSKYVDAIYPMPYPSHFGPGWGGHRNPADEPYFFVQETTKKFLEQTRNEDGAQRTKIRPWLQGFAMRVSRFGPQYIKDQIRALTDIGQAEFSVWNARNDYRVTFAALQ